MALLNKLFLNIGKKKPPEKGTKKIILMVLILDGNSEHVAHA